MSYPWASAVMPATLARTFHEDAPESWHCRGGKGFYDRFTWVHFRKSGYPGARGRFSVILGMPVLPIE